MFFSDGGQRGVGAGSRSEAVCRNDPGLQVSFSVAQCIPLEECEMKSERSNMSL